MRLKTVLLLAMTTMIYGCQERYYTEEDFSSVLKIDSHIHIHSDDGVFEGQAALRNGYRL